MNSSTLQTGSSGPSLGSTGSLSNSRAHIYGLTRHGTSGDSLATQSTGKDSTATKVRRLPFTLLELVVLAAGFGAFAALMTSCSATGSQKGDEAGPDSEAISTGLSSLLNPNSKSPKLNTPAEIVKDADYQQLTNQATLDYEALFNRDPKRIDATKVPAASSGLDTLNGTAPVIDKSEVQEQPVVLEPGQGEVGHEVVQPVATAVDTALNHGDSNSSGFAAPVVATPVPTPTFGTGLEAMDSAKPADPAVITNALSEPALAIPAFKGLKALLASRVSGYGRYVPLPSRPGYGTFVFQSARSNRAIVYIEIENFGYRPVKESDPDKMPGDQWAVDLSTEMQLLDAYDGMLQVKEPERSVIETGRNKRKDFYLVQEIELPPTLTIGSYNLKIVLRDKSGAEHVRTEAIIPIQIVADLTTIVDER